MTNRAVGGVRALTTATILFLVAGAPVAAQSVFNAAGLGVPIEALDGRSRAMGSLGVGLPGGAFMPTDPGALARLPSATGVVSTQPSWVDYSAGAEAGTFQGSRFPLLGVAYPVFNGMMSVQIGSFLDQHYLDTSTGTVNLGSGPVTTVDEFEQDGSVSNLNLGYAQPFGSSVFVGITVGRYAGSIVRTLNRTFDGEGVSGEVDPYVERGQWSYTGQHITGGISADLDDRFYVSASVQIPSALKATASEETRGSDRSFDLPVQYRMGASADFGGTLLLAASVALADWSGVQGQLSGSDVAGDSNGFGLGLEFSRARLWGKDAPLRFGFRRSNLPFGFEAGGVSERIFSGGLGLALNTSGEAVLASMDLALERGRRTGGSIVEEFWRGTISFQAAGF